MIALLLPVALAVEGDLQLRAQPSALRFSEAQVEALDPYLAADDLPYTYDCWDLIGIQSFNLDVPIDDLSLELEDDLLHVELSLGEVVGTDMLVYALDEDWTDSCPEFELELYYLTISDLHLALDLVPIRDGEELAFEVAGEPLVEGDIDMDLEWVPDDLVLYFIESVAFDMAAEAAQQELGPALTSFFGESVYQGEIEGYDLQVDVAEVDISNFGLDLGLDVQADYVGEQACETGEAGSVPGDHPELDLIGMPDRDILLGMTEGFLNQMLVEAWQAGTFCVDPGLEELAEDLSELVDPEVGTIVGLFWLDEPPALQLGEGSARLTIQGAHLSMKGEVEGAEEEVLGAEMRIEAEAGFGADPTLSSVVLSLSGLEIEFTGFTTRHLQAGDLFLELAEAAVRRFAAGWIEAELQDIVLFDSLYATWDLGLRVEQSSSQEGGLLLGLSLYDLSDPAIDREPPDTHAQLDEQVGEEVLLSWTGEDDSGEALAYAWQVNGGGWSSWSTDTEVELDLGHEGDHLIEIKARDAWQNEDPSPASITVYVNDSQEEGKAGLGAAACGCQGSPAAAPPLLVLLLPLLGRRRNS